MRAFDHVPRTRLVFGAGSITRLGELTAAAAPGARHAFLVTDPGLVRAGHAARAEASLAGAGLAVRTFAEVRENPTTTDVGACLAALDGFAADVLVGLGGGSSIDVAKACAFLHAGGGRMEDYWGVGKARGTLLPLVAVPTTAGTGSEMQSFTLIEQADTLQKMACGDPQAAPRVAVLDPELTLSQPRAVTAHAGLDAIGHAVETAVTRAGTPLSQAYSGQAFQLAQSHLPRVLEAPDDLEARGRMLLAAAFAGTAIENSMLGAAHSLANPLTARCGLVHGLAVGLMLPHVVRFNAKDPAAAARYANLSRAAGLDPSAEALARRLEELLDVAAVPRALPTHGVEPGALDALATEAAQQWTAQFNPRTVDQAALRGLLEEACGGA